MPTIDLTRLRELAAIIRSKPTIANQYDSAAAQLANALPELLDLIESQP